MPPSEGLLPRPVNQCCREEGYMRLEALMSMHQAKQELDWEVNEKVVFECMEWC
jgi:hypothetical protein